MKVFGDDPRWLFSARLDLLAFGAPALLSLALLAVGSQTGALATDAPDWIFLICIIFVDVAHVWSTLFRVYLDREERQRRPLLYFGAPLFTYILGATAYAISPATFWRALAYVAVFHFVRQQYGWVALYRRRSPGDDHFLDRALDRAVIYTATLFPLAWWHTHPGRAFHWFIAGDFLTTGGAAVIDALMPVYWFVLIAYVARQLFLFTTGKPVSLGKSLVVGTTWLMWWLGIIALNSDFAFTVTNVLIHGVPYLVLVFLYARVRAQSGEAASSFATSALRFGLVGFLAVCVGAAFLEEALWDQLVWRSRPWLRGVFAWLSGDVVSAVPAAWLVPLLALPQAVHYALDGFIWKPSGDEKLARTLFGSRKP